MGMRLITKFLQIWIEWLPSGPLGAILYHVIILKRLGYEAHAKNVGDLKHIGQMYMADTRW